MNLQVLKERVDKALEDYFHQKGSFNKLIYEAMAYSINVGGKRIRPILNLLTYSIYKENTLEILDMAMAIEMIHSYSLIHDDLPAMDNDELRRGMPTNHIKFGEAIAILAGDALLNEAMIILMNFALEKGEKAIKAGKIISEAAGANGMIGGQVVDIISEGKSIDLETLNYMHSKKTGALIKASILSGAIMGEASLEDLKILGDFGEKLGLAFQIKDDILDVTESTEVLGKPAKSDEENLKSNYVSIYGIEKCKELCSELTSDCIKLLDRIDGNVESLKMLTSMLLVRKN
ncbi:polyprenyl synthetase family protein [Clostridium massiliamazoniense]|uniref:polyprenyl synthetase family protein n=1 Tax=Clostridium massiliamazoniense TaxID=1347366 RepID=UPI0006D7E328|nr:farnesyl diphosphate synthase [Clostridium massiliamazoniense]